MASEDPNHHQSSDDNLIFQEFDDNDEALSFCDLPIYGEDCLDWNPDLLSSSSASSSDQDYFEFSSEDLSLHSYPPSDIIFCGKRITCKDSSSTESHQVHCDKREKQRKSKGFGIFKWRSGSFNKSGLGKAKVPAKFSVLASPAKSRWHLLMFGLVRFPAEMEMRDIRNRQSRRSPAALFRPYDEDVEKSRGGDGLCGLIGAVLGGGGCGGYNPNAVVKASFGCIPNV